MLFTPDYIENLLRSLNQTWFQNELAILYSNSRTEMNIRDKFNLLFANVLKDDNDYFIQREWEKRRDLAIIRYRNKQTNPVALFEFKARHAWFIASTERGKKNGESGYEKVFYGDSGVRNGVLQDINKQAIYSEKIPCYNILIGVNPLSRIPNKYSVFSKDCKEIKRINESFNKFGSAARIKELCNSNVKRFCDERDHSFFALEYNIGEALDIEWEMLLWGIYRNP
ncbi:MULTISPECIES: hypothetical protein [Paenibacillus]|uniref:NERD domain-containing protein n=2 Tax=Paenibacillus TaxID=44249 RepID=A0ABS4FRB2_9BACL|nr:MULTISPECIES: hypothetical protein [Paenibacillus]MBP1904964.1 hypothetical protein [Paenibacillus turicensis]